MPVAGQDRQKSPSMTSIENAVYPGTAIYEEISYGRVK